MKTTLLIILSLLFLPGLRAQIRFTDDRVIEERLRYSAEKEFKSWALSLGHGPILMFADITDHSGFPSIDWVFGSTLTLSKQFAPPLAMDLQFITGNMHGQNGPFFFEGDFHDVSLALVVFINQLGARPGPVNDRWNFYLKAGAGGKFFRSALMYKETGLVVPVADFGVDSRSFLVSGYDRQNPAVETSRQAEVMVPFGGGVLLRLNDHLDLGLETIMRFCASDNLDNILTGPTNDRYLFTQLNISYKFGERGAPHKRWTYRGLGLNLFGRPRRDMVREELANLEEEIARIRELPPIGKDSVVIQHTLTTIYQTLHIESIFFGENGKSVFSMEEQMKMAEMAVLMRHNPGKKLELHGYTDPSETGNHMEISAARCHEVKDFLVNELGIDAGMIITVPRGSEHAFVGNELSTPGVTRAANRRVDLVFRN